MTESSERGTKRAKIMTNNDATSNDPSHQPLMTIRRIETFSACHRLHSETLDEAHNQKIFGKCNNPNGHGHNYTLEVDVTGPVDSTTGMVMNVHDLKQIIQDKIMDVVDHKNLDKDVAHFKNLVSTTENLALFLYDQIKTELEPSLQLRITIRETDKNYVIYPPYT